MFLLILKVVVGDLCIRNSDQELVEFVIEQIFATMKCCTQKTFLEHLRTFVLYSNPGIKF